MSDTAGPVRLGVPKHGTYWGLASVDNLNLHAHEVGLLFFVFYKVF